MGYNKPVLTILVSWVRGRKKRHRLRISPIFESAKTGAHCYAMVRAHRHVRLVMDFPGDWDAVGWDFAAAGGDLKAAVDDYRSHELDGAD